MYPDVAGMEETRNLLPKTEFLGVLSPRTADYFLRTYLDKNSSIV